MLIVPCLEKALAPHSRTLAWKIPWTEEPGGLQSMGSLRVGHAEQLHFHFSLSCIGEGNGNPLQCSCLENARGGGAWWAAVSGVAQSRTRLKCLSSCSSIPCMTTCSTSIVLFFFNVCLCLIFLAPLGLNHCTGFSLVAVNRDYSLLAVLGLLFVVASPVQNTGSRARAFQQLQLAGSRV